jgi:2-haloacid dehalogenase
MSTAPLLVACGASSRGTSRQAPVTPARAKGLRAVAFDLFTIFDPREVDRRVASLLSEDGTFATAWKTRLFEYSWIRAAAGQYVDFEHLVHDALVHVAGARGIRISAGTQSELERAFTELPLWPDSLEALGELHARGLELAPLANFSPRMIEKLITRSGSRALFSTLISTDQARTYKPDPRAYALGETAFGLPRRQIAFAAFGGWDAAGARWYGYRTFWVNRLGATPEQLVVADASGPDLKALASWISKAER